MNPLLQEVTETGSCFTDFFAGVAGHPKEAGVLAWLCVWPLLAVFFALLFNFVYQSTLQGEE